MNDSETLFDYDDDPDHPGWKRWRLRDETRFNAFFGPIRVRRDGDRAIVRVVPERCHSNIHDSMHGGALLGFIDVALFAGARGLDLMGVSGAVTLDLSAQFIGASRIGEPVDAEVEVLRETGRFYFMRGLVKQHDQPLASFTGTVRKTSTR